MKNRQPNDDLREGIDLINKGGEQTFEGWQCVIDAMVQIRSKLLPDAKTTAIRTAIGKVLDSDSANDLSRRARQLLMGDDGDTVKARRSRQRASKLRQGILWMADNKAAAKGIRIKHPLVSDPATLHQAWKRDQKAKDKSGGTKPNRKRQIAEKRRDEMRRMKNEILRLNKLLKKYVPHDERKVITPTDPDELDRQRKFEQSERCQEALRFLRSVHADEAILREAERTIKQRREAIARWNSGVDGMMAALVNKH